MKIVLIDGFAKGSEYDSSQILEWSKANPPSFRVADWSVADAGFGPHLISYSFHSRTGEVFYYSCRRPD